MKYTLVRGAVVPLGCWTHPAEAYPGNKNSTAGIKTDLK
jgi:hypothetical protein